MEIDYKDIGKHIKKLRLKAKITQSMLSEKLGLSEPYISEIENGKTMLSVRSLVNIANVFKTTPDYILLGHITELKTNHKKEIDKDIMEIIDELNNEERKIMLYIMKANKDIIKNLSIKNKNQ